MRYLFSLFVLVTAANVGAQDPQESLFRAIQRGDIKSVAKAIESGADPNKSRYGLTPWWQAKMRGFESVAGMLNSKGADSNADEPNPEESLKAFLDEQVDDATPGFVVMASRDGEVILDQAAGTANAEEKKPMSSDLRFLIGSVSKQFTAAAILKLQEDGKLSVEDRLSKYISDHKSGDQITLHHLLTHTSGITNYTDNPVFGLTMNMETSEADLIKSFQYSDLLFTPGDQFAYCNSGYFLLGHIVGKVSGKSLKQYTHETFFEPLGMNDTGFHDARWDYPEEATGHNMAEGQVDTTKSWNLTRAGGAGAMYSTAGDLIKWNEALFAGKVLSDDSLKHAFSPAKLNDGSTSDYGYGFMVGTHRGLPTIWHTGGLDGFVSFLIRYPKQKLTVVALHNSMPSQDLPSHVVMGRNLAEQILWREMQPRRARVEYAIDPKLLDDFVGTYDYGKPIMMEVTREGDQLHAQLTGQEKFPIYAMDDSSFFWKITEAEVEFERGKDGKVIAAIHQQHGSKARHKRINTKPVFDLTEEQLQAFVGSYDYLTGIARFTREGKQLYAQLVGQPRLKVYPVSENVFEWRVVEAKIEFVKDENGKVTKGRHTQLGRTFDVKRVMDVKVIKVAPEKLAEFEGLYDYGFLAGKMQVKVEGDKLIAKLPGQTWLELQSVGEDRFRWKDVNASIKFERDEDGEVVRGIHQQGGRTIKAPRVPPEESEN